MERWAGRVALVTGASSGCGKDIAKQLVQHGVVVIGCAKNIQKIQELSEELRSERGSLLAVKCDLTNENEILAMFSLIREKYGGVDICVNNAGLAFPEPLLSGSTDRWRTMLEVNVLGPCICTREAVRSMQERGVDDGHIIFISSVVAHEMAKRSITHFYAASKCALRAIAQGVRNELRDRNSHIRMTSISPGVINSDFVHRFIPDEAVVNKLMKKTKPLECENISSLVIQVLASPENVEIQDIIVKGTEQP